MPDSIMDRFFKTVKKKGKPSLPGHCYFQGEIFEKKKQQQQKKTTSKASAEYAKTDD